jgi:photosystem II stability/assembly factor-like uncharacterized protein
VRCLARDPLDEAALYAGTQGAGVFRSGDQGRTWQAAGLAGQFVKSLAASQHERGVVYAGVRPAGVHLSRDGGATWRELTGFRRIPNRWWWFSPAEAPGQAYVQALSISPADANVVLAGVEFGAVVRSADGGETWSRHRRGALRDCHSLTFHARDGNWAYQAGGTGAGAAVSRDGGATWQQPGRGLARHYGVACAADPERPEVWYVSTAPSPMSAHGDKPEAYLYRAGGLGWEPIGWEAHPMRQMPIALATHPANPGQLYAGATGGEVWFSPDYGDSWAKLPFNLPGFWMPLLIL